MSARSKGSQLEKLAQAILEDQGYMVERALPKIVWIFKDGRRQPISTSHDFFGGLDLIALHPERMPRLIQITTPTNLSAKRKKLAGFSPFGCNVEVWIWKGGRGRHFRVYAHPNFADSYREEYPLLARRASSVDPASSAPQGPKSAAGDNF